MSLMDEAMTMLATEKVQPVEERMRAKRMAKRWEDIDRLQGAGRDLQETLHKQYLERLAEMLKEVK